MIYCSKCGSKVGVIGLCKVCLNNTRLAKLGMLCECGSVRSAVTGTCVRGQYCPKEKKTSDAR
jgi:hypothetical protein